MKTTKIPFKKPGKDSLYQTPPEVCRYMVSLLPPKGMDFILEPTPGEGNLVSAISERYPDAVVTAPEDYFYFLSLNKQVHPPKFDAIVMNPPFSSKSANLENAPADYETFGMKVGYKILMDCMKFSDRVIALMPWFTLTDSDVRLREIKDYGLKSITALPRKTFQYARIQTCVIELHRGYAGQTLFHVYDRLPKEESSPEDSIFINNLFKFL